MRVHKPKRRKGRSDRRFRPGPWSDGRELEPGLELEMRVLLSARAAAMMTARHARAHPTTTSTASRPTPAAEINAQYNAFANDFAAVENLYVTSISEQSSSAASIFPSFITNRTNQMAIDLVQYFNSLPLKLPYFNTPPHTPNSRGAIQNYVYSSVAGGTTSLQQSLLAIPLPTTAGSDLQIYNTAVASAIAQSRTQTLNGVSQVYAGRIRVSAPAPNNRYGAAESGTVPAYITAAS